MKFSHIFVFLIAVGCVDLTSSKEIKIAAFNIKIFGQKKVSDKAVVDVLVKIISRYDLILIQEIRDQAGTAIETLLQAVNNVSDAAYSHVISDRLGRSSSKEQYSFFYRHADFTPVATYQYPDPGDVFEREPFNVRFEVDDWALPDLVLSAIHTKPDDAVVELSRMVAVYEDLLERWDLKDVIMLGDFNADCRYVTESEWSQVDLRTDKRFEWYIEDEEDTTVRESTDCAYDRFAIAGEDLQKAVVSSEVFDFETEYELTKEMAESVSDHFPVEMTLSDSGLEMTLSDSTLRIPNDNIKDGNRDEGDAGNYCHALRSWYTFWIPPSIACLIV